LETMLSGFFITIRPIANPVDTESVCVESVCWGSVSCPRAQGIDPRKIMDRKSSLNLSDLSNDFAPVFKLAINF
jgi:hypothetical protein